MKYTILATAKIKINYIKGFDNITETKKEIISLDFETKNELEAINNTIYLLNDNSFIDSKLKNKYNKCTYYVMKSEIVEINAIYKEI